ncbi:NADH-quinone oxidoreductase subunit D [Helicobacter sp. MIT 03-1614]|jgi:NADH-quinone oxidoreductase subunit D|uniref:NADH-quinone oxidoreductase subunit D n=1 Tax=Helicobacter hepaticus (strain ATCC 51449 / 3B1) TaxID=235279 RepID=NUOD_HELHP|nr:MULTISPECIES: NADH dehydrogenase (quinone) subunit D [Helicobacter]Q7VFS5.1 RecName: Full=NADH-quinone oxidoreductase subunit D; AltName: Full=NADH dehydrogenase I subunit D; AltName: Full=NDH-1 subunit D [Helicobacter hepaticus ATCC 51449]AAP78197.1 donor-ubiquinone reductase I [Helicobacter hepaticus ATCC 51449]TLD88952.1 NADH-quinone oxidoreductase subunit D [Helicobacter sp. MIT 03-1614]
MKQNYTKLKPNFENIFFEQENDKMILNFGPQHPSAHGQLRLILELENEKIIKATPDIGYLHRGIEKMAENMIYNEFMPTTDRLDYIAATSNNYAFALGVEKLIGVDIPLRAQVIRTMLLEINRIISHIFLLGVQGMDVGALSIFLYCFIEREYGLDLMEDYCGARLTHNAIRIGGVPLDLPHNFLESVEKFTHSVPKTLDLVRGLLDKNRIWRIRLENVGYISQDFAKQWSLSGIMARGSGIKWDIRKHNPYELYSELDFEVPIATEGDCYARYQLYIEEIYESLKIIKQLIAMYPSTPKEIMAKDARYISAPKEDIMTQNYSLMQHFVLVTQGMRPPVGEVYVPTESPKGELGFFINSQGAPSPHRLKIRTPSFYHIGVLQELLIGHYFADIPAILASTNVVFGEIDR